MTYTFGVELPLPDLQHCKSFLLWGHNPSSTSLNMATDIVAARAHGMKLVAVDPRKVGIPGQANVLLQVRPGTDGALALALIHALIEENWYDTDFVRHWTNGPFLIRRDNGSALTEADLTPSGRGDRYIVWDELTDKTAIYDPPTVSFERDDVRPELFGERILRTKANEEIVCVPAFQLLAELASLYAPGRSEATTWVPAKNAWQAAHLPGNGQFENQLQVSSSRQNPSSVSSRRRSSAHRAPLRYLDRVRTREKTGAGRPVLEWRYQSGLQLRTRSDRRRTRTAQGVSWRDHAVKNSSLSKVYR